MAPRQVFFSVGDDSGDLHAANLMRSMRRIDADLRFIGLGMDRMVEAGFEPIEEQGHGESAMWLHNLLRLGHYRRRLDACARRLDEGDVSLVVPVDFGGLNLCLCREASRRGVPVFYYIPPQVWAHGRYRLEKLRKWTDRCGVIYPFESRLYRDWGVEAEYVGHPLFDEIAQSPPRQDVVAGLRERFGEGLVGIFPGSRRQEVKAHVSVLVEACRRIREGVPDVPFALLGTPQVRSLVQDLLPPDAGVAVLDDVRPVELARASRLCITKSGTVTLEVASQGTPAVIFYRAMAFAAFMGYGLAEVPYMGLVNNLAGRMVCPEKLMIRPNPGWIADQVTRLLCDAGAYAQCKQDIRQVLDGVAAPGASDRAARSALALICR